MTPSQRATIQGQIFGAIHHSAGVTDREIAHAGGLDPASLSRARGGDYEIRLSHLIRWCREYGADVVLRPVVERFDATVVAAPRGPASSLKATVGELRMHVGLTLVAIERATSDVYIEEDTGRQDAAALVDTLRDLEDAVRLTRTAAEGHLAAIQRRSA